MVYDAVVGSRVKRFRVVLVVIACGMVEDGVVVTATDGVVYGDLTGNPELVVEVSGCFGGSPKVVVLLVVMDVSGCFGESP